MNDYNYERPHKSIGNIAPKQYADIDLLKTLLNWGRLHYEVTFF